MPNNGVVLDADVLYSIEVTDVLLTMASARLIRVHWSTEILDEVQRNLTERVSIDAVSYRIEQMKRAFPGALDDAPPELIAEMSVNVKDRHVLALAVHLEVPIIVTENLRHFPARLCEPVGVEAVSPDEFLARYAHNEPHAMADVLTKMAARRRRPPKSADAIIDRLKPRYPKFATAMRTPPSPE